MDNGNAPATKRDIEELREQIRSATRQDIEELRSATKQDIEQLRSETNHQYNDLVERITDAETRLLKAFYNFGQTNSKRMTGVEDNEAAIRSRLGILEDRVMEVEKRLNMPPAA